MVTKDELVFFLGLIVMFILVWLSQHIIYYPQIRELNAEIERMEKQIERMVRKPAWPQHRSIMASSPERERAQRR